MGMGRVLSTPAKLAWALPRPCLRSCCPFAAVAPALCCCAGAHVACLCFFCCPIFVCVSGPEMWVSWGMVTANSRPRRRRRMRCLQRRRSHAPVLLRSYVDGICDPMWMAFRVAWMPEDERLPMPVTHALPAPAQTRGPVLLRLLLCCFCVLFYIWFKHHIVYDDNMVEEPNFRKLVRAARR